MLMLAESSMSSTMFGRPVRSIDTISSANMKSSKPNAMIRTLASSARTRREADGLSRA